MASPDTSVRPEASDASDPSAPDTAALDTPELDAGAPDVGSLDEAALTPDGSAPADGTPLADEVSVQASASGADEKASDEVVVGLLADPGLASDLVARVASDLPDALDGAVSGYRWRIETASGPVGLDAEGLLPMLRRGNRLRREHGWDVVVLVTDLPRRAGTQPLVSDYGSDEGVGLVSLPALGAVSLRRRLRRALVDLVADGLLGHRGAEPVRPHRHFSPPVARIASEEEGIDSHLALQGTRGTFRLLCGLVRANRPWRLVPSLSKAMAAAAAGAAFGVFYSNIWQLAESLSPVRLTVVAAIAVIAMVVWLIVDNGLWERAAARFHRSEATLFNAATTATIGLGVICMAALLMTITTLVALLVIPPSLLPGTDAWPDVLWSYLRLGVLSGSMGIVAGALGSGLTSPDAVRQAAYSTREQQRRALIDDEEPNAQVADGG
ncbi:hypothetical protein [Actinomycetospora termitidis]|uniref:Uncharacterized protein n=1 Tax=Actinomycetospora termitidis TaxID=3053470 RepID=A0ABT7MGQ1_9PSEU|nr:hypothetical protein [Actinomycetospora sp. Odt1-22]MDL5159861.1 hypothetical protein [Actinomycetospora sp. Odt1-22]